MSGDERAIAALVAAYADAAELVVVGTYRDRYVRQDDGWRFAHRHYDVLHRSINRGEQR